MKRWKLATLIAAAVVLVAALIAGVIWWVGGDQSERAHAIVEALLTEAQGRPPERPVLRGAAVPGNAWDDYALALSAAANKSDPKAIEHLRDGVRKSGAQYPFQWTRGMEMPMPDFRQVELLANLCVARSGSLRAERRADEAATLMLDLAQFGRDMRHNGVLITDMVGQATLRKAFDELRDILASGELKQDAHARVARELEVLDGSMPKVGVSILNECAGASVVLAGVAESGLTGPGLAWRETWRHGFSSRRLAAEAIVHYDSMARRAAIERPWPEMEAHLRALDEETRAARNWFVQTTTPTWRGLMRDDRECTAKLRLLRAAAHWRATGEAPALDDPFGAKILRRDRRLSSVGPNGTDDGGKGDDIVLDVP